MTRHSSSDPAHDSSRTYGGSRDEATRNALEQKLVREGKVLPGTTPHGQVPDPR